MPQSKGGLKRSQVPGTGPRTAAEAEIALVGLQEALVQPQEQGTGLNARFGPSSNKLTGAIRRYICCTCSDMFRTLVHVYAAYHWPEALGKSRCLAQGDSDVIGVLAQLGTVQDEALGSALAAHMASSLAVLLVADPPCRKRLSSYLQVRSLPGMSIPIHLNLQL